MSDWDWTFVAELAIGVALGIIIGGWVFVAILRSLVYETLSHPTTRKLATAAEKLAGAKGGGGIIEQIIGSVLGGNEEK